MTFRGWRRSRPRSHSRGRGCCSSTVSTVFKHILVFRRILLLNVYARCESERLGRVDKGRGFVRSSLGLYGRCGCPYRGRNGGERDVVEVAELRGGGQAGDVSVPRLARR